MVRFHCIRSNGNARKHHETSNGNTGYPSCFQNGLTCFCHVSVYGFLQFRPVLVVCSEEGLMLQMSAFKLFTVAIYIISSVDNTKWPCYTLPPLQHHRFLRNLTPLFIYQFMSRYFQSQFLLVYLAELA